MNAVCNEHSTCEWVDEAYSKRLWGQLLRRLDAQHADGAKYDLRTVRKYAIEVWKTKVRKIPTHCAVILVPAPAHALDVVNVLYKRDGTYACEMTMLRISGHAGQRLFQHLRTNSDVDLLDTVLSALVAVMQGDHFRAEFRGPGGGGPMGADIYTNQALAVELDWGTLHLAPSGGLWIAKTFIPGEQK